MAIIIDIKEFVAGGIFLLAVEVANLIVTINVISVAPAIEFNPLGKFIFDIGFARQGCKGW